jgi:hypothetical protein
MHEITQLLSSNIKIISNIRNTCTAHEQDRQGTLYLGPPTKSMSPVSKLK